MYNRRRRYDRYERSENNHEKHSENETKKYSKSLVLLKSSVFALFIVLLTLTAAYLIVKNKKSDIIVATNPTNCSKNKVIKISQEIDEIKENDDVIIVLTKEDKNNKRELIRIDASCGNELNRILFQEVE